MCAKNAYQPDTPVPMSWLLPELVCVCVSKQVGIISPVSSWALQIIAGERAAEGREGGREPPSYSEH